MNKIICGLCGQERDSFWRPGICHHCRNRLTTGTVLSEKTLILIASLSDRLRAAERTQEALAVIANMTADELVEGRRLLCKVPMDEPYPPLAQHNYTVTERDIRNAREALARAREFIDKFKVKPLDGAEEFIDYSKVKPIDTEDE